MFSADLMIRADKRTLEQRPRIFNVVSGDVSSRPFFFLMGNAFMFKSFILIEQMFLAGNFLYICYVL